RDVRRVVAGRRLGLDPPDVEGDGIRVEGSAVVKRHTRLQPEGGGFRSDRPGAGEGRHDLKVVVDLHQCVEDGDADRVVEDAERRPVRIHRLGIAGNRGREGSAREARRRRRTGQERLDHARRGGDERKARAATPELRSAGRLLAHVTLLSRLSRTVNCTFKARSYPTPAGDSSGCCRASRSVKRSSTFAVIRETGPSYASAERAPHQPIEPTENTAPPAAFSR